MAGRQQCLDRQPGRRSPVSGCLNWNMMFLTRKPPHSSPTSLGVPLLTSSDQILWECKLAFGGQSRHEQQAAPRQKHYPPNNEERHLFIHSHWYEEPIVEKKSNQVDEMIHVLEKPRLDEFLGQWQLRPASCHWGPTLRWTEKGDEELESNLPNTDHLSEMGGYLTHPAFWPTV